MPGAHAYTLQTWLHIWAQLLKLTPQASIQPSIVPNFETDQISSDSDGKSPG